MKQSQPKKEVNKGQLNSIRQLVNKPYKKQNTVNTIVTNNNAKSDHKFKFQSMGKMILNQIDDFLKDQPSQTGSSVLINSDVNTDLDYLQFSKEEKELEKNLMKSNISNSIEEEYALPLEEEKVPNSDVFMTKVGIHQNKQKKSKYMEEQDKKVRELLDNVDEIDDLLDEKEEREFIRRNPDKREEVMKMKEMIDEVDKYKKSLKDEFDELQQIMKFVDDTADRIKRHKQGVSKIYKKAGVNVKEDFIDTEKDVEVKTYYTSDGAYDGKKNLNSVKFDLDKLQDIMLDYYRKFNHKMGLNEDSEEKKYPSHTKNKNKLKK